MEATVTAGRVLVVVPDTAAQQGLCSVLQNLDLLPIVVHSCEQADALSAARGPFTATVVDVSRADVKALETLRRSRLRHEDPGPLVVLAKPDDPTRLAKTDLLGTGHVLLAPWSTPI